MALNIPAQLANLDNVHAAHLQDLIGHAPAPGPIVPVGMRIVFLCFTNRCGSNYAAQLFASTGAFNLAREFFNFDNVRRAANRQQLRHLGEYVTFLCSHFSKSGLLVCKLSASHLMLLQLAGILERLLPHSRFITLERNDRLAQAISFVIADRTRQWTSQVAADPATPPPQFNRTQLEYVIGAIIEQQAALSLFFAMNGIVPHTLNYERLVLDANSEIQAACDWLHVIAPPISGSDVAMTRQSTELNTSWRNLFLS